MLLRVTILQVNIAFMSFTFKAAQQRWLAAERSGTAFSEDQQTWLPGKGMSLQTLWNENSDTTF